MSQLPVDQIPARIRELDLKGAKVHHLPDWGGYDDPQKMAVIRKISEMRGRDPRIVQKAVSIIKKAKVKPRQYDKQAAALLKWVQTPKNIYYVNEAGERLQDPIYTLNHGHGDCDDQILLLCSFFESIRLPWKLVISGRRKTTGQKVRYIEGMPYPRDCTWTHIYCMVGTPPFRPTKWYFCECTVEGVPLGWDVVSGDHRYLPEMSSGGGPARLMRAKPAPIGYKPKRPPRGKAVPPAYGNIAQVMGTAVGQSIHENDKILNWKKLVPTILTGVAVAIGTQLALDWVRGKGIWEKEGNVATRLAGVRKESNKGLVLGGLYVGK